ncbi:hypothetical protein CAPTEDRAFT_177545 [Capitella teleta]|uniref:GST C-terminal domain-containing protein n=1 Tax=Capitella teleta TaxID=283909 RepID=R7V691_CAPTE|nr:hypothetical protein CAPTEDRAFT_177545 [Capitella teleta]|eukprot:ELU13992.1 hypothetical protein CAPTEDRAFT_177545 [Capitella teleta]
MQLSKIASTFSKGRLVTSLFWRNRESISCVIPSRKLWFAVTADGSSGFQAERDRYHLYVSLACPWAHRATFIRAMKGLENAISLSVVDWLLIKGQGWKFTDLKPRCTLDPVNNCAYLKEIYHIASAEYHGNITVPLLWDKKQNTIVSNESSEILRMLNSEFNEYCDTSEHAQINLYPDDLQKDIDELNVWIYRDINNGVYRAGFAKSQEAYDGAVFKVFDALDEIEQILSQKRYLTGSRFTEVDVRLFTTLIRFDMVYYSHFKCSKKRVADYPNIWGYVRDIYQMPGIADTVDFEHIRKHYMESHLSINPTGIVSVQPELDFMQPHGRETLSP